MLILSILMLTKPKHTTKICTEATPPLAGTLRLWGWGLYISMAHMTYTLALHTHRARPASFHGHPRCGASTAASRAVFWQGNQCC